MTPPAAHGAGARRLLFAAVLFTSTASTSGTDAAPVRGDFTPSTTPGVSFRRWADPGASRPRQHVEVRNDRDEAIWFRLVVWTTATEKRSWDVSRLATNETFDIAIDGPSVDRVVIEKLESESDRRRSHEGSAPAWRTADAIFKKGTKSVRFHLDDSYSFNDRKVRASISVVNSAIARLGWGTWVYPDAQAKNSGKQNASFYFGLGQFGTDGPTLIGGPPLLDGAIWELEIKIESVEAANQLSFKGLDGVVVIESPRPLYHDAIPRIPFKVGVGGRTRVRFAVAAE